MDTMTAYMMGQMNRGREQKVFDWNKAASLIKELKIKNAVAGLQCDMEWTSGLILEDGEPVDDCYTYLASTWATPVLVPLDKGCDHTEIPCYIMGNETEWNAKTKWPISALRILKGDKKLISELEEEVQKKLEPKVPTLQETLDAIYDEIEAATGEKPVHKPWSTNADSDNAINLNL